MNLSTFGPWNPKEWRELTRPANACQFGGCHEARQGTYRFKNLLFDLCPKHAKGLGY